MQDWLTMGAADLGRGIEAGQIDPRTLCETYLNAIDTHPEAARIYARTTPDRARAEAAAAADRAARGLRRGLLDGVPISWKDLFDTAGVATESGSALLQGRVPAADAAVLARATAAGLVCLGKTHQTELAFSGLGLNPVTASPPCINDPAAVSGGSSSGAAASVAFGLAAAGIGSDTGGSVRVPAGWNDLVGLKTTAGRLPLTGVLPLAARFDTVGPLTRSVEDAALLLAALEGGRAPDLAGAGLGGLRLAVLRTVALDGLEGPVGPAFEAALTALAAAGAHLTEIDRPEVAEAMELAPILFATEAYGTWKHLIEAHPERMFPPVRDRFRGGAAFGGADYVAAWQRLDQLRAIWGQAVAGHDAVLVPTVPILPPAQADVLADHALFNERNLKTLRNTRIGNLLGLCALTLPTGVASVGVTLMAAPGAEERLLRIGAAAARALG